MKTARLVVLGIAATAGGADVPADAVPSNRVNMVRFDVSTTAITK